MSPRQERLINRARALRAALTANTIPSWQERAS